MKLNIERDVLAKALSVVTRVVQAKAAIEVMEHVLVFAEGAAVTITGIDTDLMMAVTVPAQIEVGGTITIHASTLSDYVNRLPAGAAITLSLSDDIQRVILQSRRSRAALGTLNPLVFPVPPAVDAEHGFEIEGQTMARLLSSVDFATGLEANLALCGVSMSVVQDDRGPTLRTAAADGRRAAKAMATCPRSADGLPDVILPKRTSIEITKLAAAAGLELISVSLSRNQMQVVAGNATLTTKLVEATFPDVDLAIAVPFDKFILVDGQEFKSAFARSAIVADDKYRSSRISFSAGLIEITSRSSKAGDIVETVEAEYDGPDFSLSLDGKFARDILTALDCDTVRISCGEPGAPTLWASPADASRQYVLMPLRV